VREPSVSQRALPALAAGLAVACYAILGSGWLEPLQLARNHFRLPARPGMEVSAEQRAKHPTSSFAAWKQTFVASYEETPDMVFKEDAYAAVLAVDLGNEAFLYVNTKADASTRQDLPTQMLLAHAPLFLNPRATSVLVIGHGSGVTLGSALQHPIERADVVEISSAVLAMDPIFSVWNHYALDDPRTNVHVEDAQAFLRTVPRQYDVIISEPTNPWIAGVSGLFTLEYFEAIRSKLAPGGVAAVWFQQYKMSDATAMMILRTLNEAFPYVSLWRSPSYNDVIAVASAGPLDADFEAMERRFNRPEIRNDIARMGVPNLASYLIHNAVGPEGVLRLIEPGPLNTLGHQRLEFDAPRDFFYRKRAGFVRRADPLQSEGLQSTDIALDRYLDWRRAVGDPVDFGELEYVSRVSSPSLAASLRARAPEARGNGRQAVDPSRGVRAPARDMQIYEAAYWGNRLRKEGSPAEAVAYDRRARRLLDERDARARD
jgi:spermidine synthase